MAVLLWLLAAPALALEVGVAGVLPGKALLVVDGMPRTLALGQTVQGIKLLALDGEQVTLEVEGKRRVARVGQQSAWGDGKSSSPERLSLIADSQGHYFLQGTINNGGSQRFMVDTGATMVTLGQEDARRLGLDLSHGEMGVSQTANGLLRVTRIKLNTLRLGDVVLYNVDALVSSGSLPVALLGMSALKQLDMQRDGDRMVLTKRY